MASYQYESYTIKCIETPQGWIFELFSPDGELLQEQGTYENDGLALIEATEAADWYIQYFWEEYEKQMKIENEAV